MIGATITSESLENLEGGENHIFAHNQFNEMGLEYYENKPWAPAVARITLGEEIDSFGLTQLTLKEVGRYKHDPIFQKMMDGDERIMSIYGDDHLLAVDDKANIYLYAIKMRRVTDNWRPKYHDWSNSSDPQLPEKLTIQPFPYHYENGQKKHPKNWNYSKGVLETYMWIQNNGEDASYARTETPGHNGEGDKNIYYFFPSEYLFIKSAWEVPY